MGQSVLVFVSHSSEDKQGFIEPLVADLEACYINVWLDKKRIMPGDNLRQSIFKDGLDKADIALIYFTHNSLESGWVDTEIKYVLREQKKKGNDFDLSKIISIFDSSDTYEKISDKYPELTDDLLHLMPNDYNKAQFGQLISAIWSKYFSLQGGEVENQRQLFSKDKELFARDKEILELKNELKHLKKEDSKSSLHDEFELLCRSGKIGEFISHKDMLLKTNYFNNTDYPISNARAFGFIEKHNQYEDCSVLTDKGKEFFKWVILNSKF